jgi:hypothetical protein
MNVPLVREGQNQRNLEVDRVTPFPSDDCILTIRTPGVNFTNIIRAAFAPIFLRQKSLILKSKYKKVLRKHLYEKVARKMLMKLAPVSLIPPPFSSSHSCTKGAGKAQKTEVSTVT